MSVSPRTIAVLRPALPLADQVLPWLRQIDAARLYSNHGPLVTLFSQRLSHHFSIAENRVVPVANATIGIIAALLAQGVAEGGLCLMPAWTFAATGHAARAAGLQPWLADVDEQSWALTPDLAHAALVQAKAQGLGPVSAVIPVAPFGAPIDWLGWDQFQQDTGLPVVIDAAAAFDSLRPGRVPAVVSLHATKVIGVGEGGFIISQDADLIRNCLRAVNFGFLGSRVAAIPAINGKMSEIHAAVGLAALEDWPQRRREQLGICAALLVAVTTESGVTPQPGWGRDWVSGTCIVRFAISADGVEGVLAQKGIETRRWWGNGLLAHPAFAGCPTLALPVTEQLAATTLGLPCHGDLADEDIARIGAAVAVALAGDR